jgi:hypothetical protein
MVVANPARLANMVIRGVERVALLRGGVWFKYRRNFARWRDVD